MTIRLIHGDNMEYNPPIKFDLIFADYVYQNTDFSWAEKFWEYLKPDSCLVSMTDFHSVHRYRVFMEDKLGATFVNDIVWRCEWGRSPSDRMHQCYDNVIVYANSDTWKFYPDRIQIPKATAKSKGLNPSGRKTKTSPAWIDDVVLTTVAKERVKKPDGHLVRWQKPLRLYDRIIAPFTDEGDLVLDLFMGVGSLARWCNQNNRNYIGIENDREVFKLAEENVKRD